MTNRQQRKKTNKRGLRKVNFIITLGLLLGSSITGIAWAQVTSTALPQGGASHSTTIDTKSYTDATIATKNSVMTITQNKLVNTGYIDWHSFNIGSQATVNFKQQSSGQTMVNQVAATGGLSEIYGKLNASGNVVLINPNGVLFDGAKVNVGGLAVYGAASTDLSDAANAANEGSITIKNSVIKAGISSAHEQANAMNISDYAVGIAANANKIRLVANGNMSLDKADLTAMDKTISSGSSIQGEEGFTMGGNASIAYGQVIIRSDANADDYGAMTVANNPKIKTTESYIYYNPQMVGTAVTQDGKVYNKKDYKNGVIDFSSVMDSTSSVTKYTVTTDTTGLYAKANVTTATVTGTSSANARMLVNNIAQLQDIEDSTVGNLEAAYALGKDINATGDKASYLIGTVVYKDDGSGKLTALSAVDNGVFTSSTEKITAAYTITYADSQVATTVDQVGYTYNGTNYYKDGQQVADPSSSLPTALINNLATAYTEFTNAENQLDQLGQDLQTIDSSKWNQDSLDTTVYHGFNPIGDNGTGAGATGAFTGSFDGFGGDKDHSITNLTINRGTEDNVGLFGYVDGGSLTRVYLSAGRIPGQNNVGSVAGTLKDGSLSWSQADGDGIKGTVDASSGFVKVTGTGARSNIGGLIGAMDGSSVSESSSTVTVIGLTDDQTVNVSKVGGIAGSMTNDSQASNIANGGNVFGEENTGGLIGYGSSSQIGVDSTIDNLTAASFNSGQISGVENTGGIAGYIQDTKLHGVYNTNEDSALSANSQYYLDATGKITKQGGDAGKKLAGDKITDAAALSAYGKITGTTSVGGIVGNMEDSSADNSKSEINTAYNAGNVTGTTSVGGLVGNMTGGKISYAYNGDNNTVLREDIGTVPPEVKTDTEVPVNGITYTFSYNKEAAAYYSFYTVSGNTKTYYYFKPEGSTTTKGAGGIFVNAAGDYVADLPAEADRYYLNRVGYKDAHITGAGSTVGGLVGSMSGGGLDTVYNLGTVTASDGGTKGAMVGTAANASLTNCFYVTGKDLSTGKDFSSAASAFASQGDSVTDYSLDYTISQARNRAVLAYDFEQQFVGRVVTHDQDTGYGIYTKGGTTYYFDDTDNIFTKSGDDYTAQYTKVTTGEHQGQYKDTADNYYTYQAAEDGNSFTLTPVPSGTALTFAGTLEPSHQSANWLVYQQQTAPLLKYFMNTTNINRVFAYDGTTHNLKTDDVNNLYGRADFAIGSGAGQKVQSTGYANSNKYSGSSVYYYDNSSIWSPQHGYKMDPSAAVVITPINLSVTLSGNKVYGDGANLKGYYICVPYTTTTDPITNKKTTTYTFYTVNGTTYTKVTDLATFFGSYSQDAAGIQKKADAEGKYLVTMNGIVYSEIGNIDAAVNGVVTSMGNETSGTNFVGDIWGSAHDKTDDQQLNAGDYSFTTEKGSTLLSGVQAQNNDYNISYDGKLKVSKADLYYTVAGTREYGEENSTGTYNYQLVGKDADSTDTSVRGYLKSWDQVNSLAAGSLNITNVMDKTENYTLKGYDPSGAGETVKYITKDGSEGDTTGQYKDVVVDSQGNVSAYVLTEWQDSGNTFKEGTGLTEAAAAVLNTNYNLVWLQGAASHTFVTTGTNKELGTTQAKVNNSTLEVQPVNLTVNVSGTRSYGDTMNAAAVTSGGDAVNKNYNVTVTTGDGYGRLKNGDTLLGGQVLEIGANAANSLSKVLAGVDGPQSSAIKIGAQTDVGTYDIKQGTSAYTDSGLTLSGSAANNNYLIIDGTDTIKIEKAKITVAVSGSKIYGEKTLGINTDNVYAVNASGLKNGEKFDTSKVQIENTVGQDAGAGTYASGNAGGSITGVSDYVNDPTGKSTFKVTNYDISFDAARSNYVVNKRNLVINTEGSRTYGDDNSQVQYTITDASTEPASGLTTLDKRNIYDAQVSAWTGRVANNTSAGDDAGSYGTEGKGTQVLRVDVTQNNTLTQNYIITYTDKFDIDKRNIKIKQSGSREYGTGNEHAVYSEREVEGLNTVLAGQTEDILQAFTGLINRADRTTAVGIYSNKNGTAVVDEVLKDQAAVMKNYSVDADTVFTITPADFTYTADHTEYWQGTPIPAQTGKVTNKYGEDVSNLVGRLTWGTAADTFTPGVYAVEGRGSNDHYGNYLVLQSTEPANSQALLVKQRIHDLRVDYLQAFGLTKQPLLDVRYLSVSGTEGLNRWKGTPVVEADYGTTVLYDKNKVKRYQL